MANMGMSKQAWGDRVSTISLLGCSTSVALATGPTERRKKEEIIQYKMFSSECIAVLDLEFYFLQYIPAAVFFVYFY